MHFSLDVLPALKGDCLMLHYGSPKDLHLMLIDGGPANVYVPELKPRIEMVHAARGLDENDALPVDVVMVSHIDDDHIRGILELTKEQRRNSPGLRLEVGSLWHNSFEDLLTTKPGQLLSGFGAASILAGINPASVFSSVEPDDEDHDKIEMHQAVEVLSSIPQGQQLRSDAEVLGWKINRKFKGKLIVASANLEPVTLDGGLKLTVAGPMQPELLALQEAHDKWLRERKDGHEKTPQAMLAAFVDKSVPNLSSIVVLAELCGKSMLLTGDARGDKILEGLELAGVLKPKGKKAVNLLKVPHHGSSNNMEPIFFERLPADHYVFSGDGQHGNPRRQTLEMLLEARGEAADYKIHLTYPIAAIDRKRKEDWNKERGKEQARKKKYPKTKKLPRGAWSPQQHSLAAFFKKYPKMAKKVRIAGKPHLIDLLEPLSLEAK